MYTGVVIEREVGIFMKAGVTRNFIKGVKIVFLPDVSDYSL